MKQAVIVIHGIGEQRPMSTLRDFVDAVIPDPEGEGRVKFHSKPDRMSQSFELRKLQSLQTRSAPITDFYEYYWAYLIEGTRYAHIVSWLKELLWRSPRNVPPRLQPIWYLSWLLIVLFALTSAGLLVPSHYLPQLFSGEGRLTTWIVSALLLPTLQFFVLAYVGDAARYLSPTPSNISIRRKVRADGIRLLRQLHSTGQYDRIIVVGHSLGSVIAYDVLYHYWQEVNTKIGRTLQPDQSALKALERLGQALNDKCSPQELAEFQQAQWALWRSQCKLGNPWRITDFISIGSPLVHSEMLLARSKAELRQRQSERELSTCPPQADRGKYSYLVNYKVNNQPRSCHVLHHAALFACTRWTNLYFPGDFVGGPLAPVFGPGIADVRVGSGVTAYTPLSHTCYWSRKRCYESSVHALVSALALESKSSLAKPKPHAPAVPVAANAAATQPGATNPKESEDAG
jgi:hypothetical protein